MSSGLGTRGPLVLFSEYNYVYKNNKYFKTEFLTLLHFTSSSLNSIMISRKVIIPLKADIEKPSTRASGQ